MKKYISLILVVAIIFCTFVSCQNSGNETNETTKLNSNAENIIVKIDANVFNEDFSEETLKKSLTAIDGLTYTKNDAENLIVLDMTESAYSKLKQLKGDEAKEQITSVKNDENCYAAEITFDDDLRNIILKADFEKLNGAEVSPYDDTVLKVVSYAMIYQLFTVEGQSVTVKVISNSDNSLLGEYKFPLEL